MVRNIYDSVASPDGPRIRVARNMPLAVKPGEPGAKIAGLTSAALLALFMASLFIPVGGVRLAGIRLAPYTVVLLVVIVPLLRHFLMDRTNRITAPDIFLLAYVAWLALSIYHHYGTSRAVFIVNQTITTMGGYLLTRTLIRSAEDYERFFRYFFYGLVLFLPFALFELVTRTLIINEILEKVPGRMLEVYPRAGQDARLGLNRVQGWLPHSITFGLFCSIGVANLFYIHRETLSRQLSRTGVAVLMTFISLSSAPVISLGIQFILIAWDRLTRFLPGRWFILIGGGLIFVAFIQLALENGLVGLVIENFAFDERTGWGRTEIIEYGSAEVARHPLFGIGLGEWVRPWWRKGSVDNFWLLMAMRYGLPALIFLWLTLGLHVLGLLRAGNLSARECDYRTGHLIAWAGVFFILGTVHIWDAVAVFVMAYLGAGAWLYTRMPEDRTRRLPGRLNRGPAADGDEEAEADSQGDGSSGRGTHRRAPTLRYTRGRHINRSGPRT